MGSLLTQESMIVAIHLDGLHSFRMMFAGTYEVDVVSDRGLRIAMEVAIPAPFEAIYQTEMLTSNTLLPS